MKTSDYDHLVKIGILGDRGVGKTALVRRFADDEFKDYCSWESTNPFAIPQVEIQGKKFKPQVWDTADQSKHAYGTSNYRGAKIIVVCFDLTDVVSFNRVVTHWLPFCKDYYSDAKILIVGCKSDLTTKRVVDQEPINKLISTYNLIYMETSSLSGYNVKAAFEKILIAWAPKPVEIQTIIRKHFNPYLHEMSQSATGLFSSYRQQSSEQYKLQEEYRAKLEEFLNPESISFKEKEFVEMTRDIIHRSNEAHKTTNPFSSVFTSTSLSAALGNMLTEMAQISPDIKSIVEGGNRNYALI